jgi:hypothetical protein
VGIFFTTRSIFTSIDLIEKTRSPLDLPRLPSATTESLYFLLAFNTERCIGLHLQPTWLDRLATTHAGAVVAFLNRSQGSLNILQFGFEDGDERGIFLAFKNFAIAFIWVDIDFGLHQLTQMVEFILKLLLFLEQSIFFGSDLVSTEHNRSPDGGGASITLKLYHAHRQQGTKTMLLQINSILLVGTKTNQYTRLV